MRLPVDPASAQWQDTPTQNTQLREFGKSLKQLMDTDVPLFKTHFLESDGYTSTFHIQAALTDRPLIPNPTAALKIDPVMDADQVLGAMGPAIPNMPLDMIFRASDAIEEGNVPRLRRLVLVASFKSLIDSTQKATLDGLLQQVDDPNWPAHVPGETLIRTHFQADGISDTVVDTALQRRTVQEVRSERGLT